jgi:NADH-quinone oxidoreductase subunit J
MNIFDISLYIVEILIAVLAVYAAETKNLAYAILSFLGISVLTAIIFYMLGAIFVSVVQLAVFSGAIVVMFIFVFVITKGGVPRDESEE